MKNTLKIFSIHFKKNLKIMIPLLIISTIIQVSTFSLLFDKNISETSFTLTMSFIFAFGIWTIVSLSIITSANCLKILGSERKTNALAFWLTSPVSRNSIIFGKYLYILLFTLIIYLPIPICSISAGIANSNLHKFMDRIIIQNINFFVFMIFIITIIFFICSTLINKNWLANILCAVFILWFILSNILVTLSQLPVSEEVAKYLKLLEFVKYISLQNLVSQLMTYNPEQSTSESEFADIDGLRIGLSIMGMLIVTPTLLLIISMDFKNKQLSV